MEYQRILPALVPQEHVTRNMCQETAPNSPNRKQSTKQNPLHRIFSVFQKLSRGPKGTFYLMETGNSP